MDGKAILLLAVRSFGGSGHRSGPETTEKSLSLKCTGFDRQEAAGAAAVVNKWGG